ncbi:hypothetical protein Cni_G07583 [Canna indica]|uniref:Uncharacterized protein n=1 Tax=Canna indica TaxID=4628 RepID=A0AAQ3JZB6_9LILI|nr:hypothetical protein Cni_G07583 [Canna indica]
MDNDYCSRREKGFPGIRVVLNRKIISQADTFWIPREQESLKCHLWDDNSQGFSNKTVGSTLLSNLMYQNFRSSTPVSENLHWDAVISYAQCLSAVYMGRNKASNFSHELFKSVHSAVFQAGEQGLAMNEISQAVDPHVKLSYWMWKAKNLTQERLYPEESMEVVDSNQRKDAEERKCTTVFLFLKSRILHFIREM